MFFDLNELLYLLPAIILGAWAQWKIHSAYSAAKEMTPASGATGAEAAAVILKQAGLQHVEIEESEGFLSDHYDPRAKVLRLSPDVYSGRTLAAIGIAAHEAGHAIQDGTGYRLLVMRNAIVPLASVGGNLTWVLMFIGVVFQSLMLIKLGIIFFSATVIFQLVNLPVEFDASRRAKEIIGKLGLVRGEEEATAVREVLSAAAMTYVAATLMALLQLLYFISLLQGGRRNDA